MAIRKIPALLFFLCAGFCFSQNRDEAPLASSEGGSFRVERAADGRQIIFQKLSWIRNPHDFRYEAFVEKQSEAGEYKEIHHEKTENNFIELSLDRGLYRYRVAVYNLLDQLEYTTSWADFRILPALRPRIDSVNPAFFGLQDDSSFSIEITGENFLPETGACLVPRGGGAEIKPSGYTAAPSGKSAKIVFKPELLKTGDYELCLRNAGNFEDRAGFSVKQYRSPFDFFAALAYSPLVLAHGYLDAFFDKPLHPAGASLRTDLLFRNEGTPWRAGLSARFSGGRMISGENENGMKTSMWITGLLADFLLERQFSGGMAIHTRAGGGIVSILNMRYEFSGGSASDPKSTWMAALDGGVSWVWLFSRHAFVEAGLDYIFLFSTDSPRPGFVIPFTSVGWRY